MGRRFILAEDLAETAVKIFDERTRFSLVECRKMPAGFLRHGFRFFAAIFFIIRFNGKRGPSLFD